MMVQINSILIKLKSLHRIKCLCIASKYGLLKMHHKNSEFSRFYILEVRSFMTYFEIKGIIPVKEVIIRSCLHLKGFKKKSSMVFFS